jgi:hypothetical protein
MQGCQQNYVNIFTMPVESPVKLTPGSVSMICQGVGHIILFQQPQEPQ